MGDTQRFLLCRPRGGLSDALSAIEWCRQHCDRTGRTLIVDGVRSNFARRFSDVFETDAAVLGPDRALFRHLETLSCRPAEVRGRLRSYAVKVHTAPGENFLEWRRMLDARTGAPLHAPLDEDHPEDVLLFEAHGNGIGGEAFLARCRLTPRVSLRVEARLNTLRDRLSRPGYMAIHVRNSDLRSQWRVFLAEQSDALAGCDVVVCSDDRAVTDAAPRILRRSRVVSPTRVPVSNGVPYQAAFVPRWRHSRLVVDTFVDLFALAGAEEILCPPVTNRSETSSSFTRLARAVAGSPGLAERLLGRA